MMNIAMADRPVRLRQLAAVALSAVLALQACKDEKAAMDVAAVAEALIAPEVAAVTADRIIHADDEPDNWLSHGRTYDEQRFSPLQQVNADNVAQLGLAWYYDLDSTRGQEATPLVVDGVMYVSTAWSKVKALNAGTGELIWAYDPQVPGERAVHFCCDVVNRGVAVWQGRVYIGTLDGRLVALDAASGKQVWEVQTTDPELPYSITGAPRIVKGKVIIGNGGAEFGVRGYVSAYDATSGALSWRFFTVPGNPQDGFESPALERAASTWNGEWWKLGGGGTVWDSMAYDAELDLLYIGTGNGSPWNQHIRSPGGGDNLYLSSIVALNPDTGAYVWHYQTTPGETWDYTATQHMILADLEINGRVRKVIMQAPKNGFFYVLDRVSGELLSAEPFVPVNWAERIDLASGRPVENPQARFSNDKPALVQPGPAGGHNWQPMSFSPLSGLVYIPAMDMGFPFFADKDFAASNRGFNIGVDLGAASMPTDPKVQQEILATVKGQLKAWDPVRQQEVWRVEHKGPWNGGVLSTAGNLVIQGVASGELVIYRADTGERLWSASAQSGIIAAPMTYAVDGEQYIAVAAGWGGVLAMFPGVISHMAGKARNISRILAYKLGGNAVLPAAPAASKEARNLPPLTAGEPVIAEGKHLYHRYCVMCHGDTAVGGGMLPDLRYSAALGTDLWSAYVSDGILAKTGMVNYSGVLTPAQIKAIESYVISRALESGDAEHE
jgi:alcohol dehydrogenase (cytochrome c)/quinohemoprotein ethanol dehydrogenase